ncbi:aspartate aminotransferase family protein [Nonomuraea sp. NN258]|nr:aspartate aminotransferase family protein [Nonomuraea antri]
MGARPELLLAGGRGAVLIDTAGRRLLDTTAGLGQCAVGYGRAELAEAAAAQMRALAFFPLAGAATEAALRLADRLVELGPAAMSRVLFTSGGSEGVETAIKLARLAWHHQGEADRQVILTRHGAYHGATSAAPGASGIAAFQHGFGPPSPGFVHLSPAHARPLGANATDVLVAELEESIEEVGARRIAALLAEPIMGMAGMIPPPPGYWPRVQEVLRRHGILLITDEVATGYGRAAWFAAAHFDLAPDLLVTAKALTSGYVPMGAVLAADRVQDMLGGQPLMHLFTFGGHAAAAAVALANLDLIEGEGLIERAAELGARVLAELGALSDRPRVAEVRGAGLMLAIELTEPMPGLKARAIAAGILLRPVGDRVVLTPPLVLTDEQAERITAFLIANLR